MAAEKSTGSARWRAAALSTAPVLALAAALLASGYERAPLEWSVDSVPVAFWSWQSESPSEGDVRRAVVEAGARELFLRAGQVDLEGGRLMRIRAVKGRLPRTIRLHLVYNATRSVLNEFERISPEDLAATVLALFDEDAGRAERDGARVAGLQLDIDVPTRLLARYARALRSVRASLPLGMRLSITGLPTWIESPELKVALAEVDFWVPQLYGARVPDRLDRPTPISSPESVAAAIERVRKLDRPFYAGLAAYGYAMHYSRDGSLLSLRGDLDPGLVAHDGNFELVERRPFGPAGEWCYVFRARADGVIDGTVAREGEWLVLDVPAARSLRECARAVRKRSGEKLLGICVFRLPSPEDPTTLSIEQIAAALADDDAQFAVEVEARSDGRDERSREPCRLDLVFINRGSVGARIGEGAMVARVRLGQGNARRVSLDGFRSSRPLCAADEGAEPEDDSALRACSPRRADVLRLEARAWPSGAVARASVELSEAPREPLSIYISVSSDDGREWHIRKTVAVRANDEKRVLQ